MPRCLTCLHTSLFSGQDTNWHPPLLLRELNFELALVAEQDSPLLTHLTMQKIDEHTTSRYVEEEEEERPETPENIADVDVVVRHGPVLEDGIGS